MTTTDRELVMAVARANRAKFATSLKRHFRCHDGGIGDDADIWLIWPYSPSTPLTGSEYSYVAKSIREGKW
jgi:hypothetical protein